MGIGDKLKFWKKDEDDFSDLGDFGLGDFGGSSKPSAQPNDDLFGSEMKDPMAEAGNLSPDMGMDQSPNNYPDQGINQPMDMGNQDFGMQPQPRQQNFGMQQQPQRDMRGMTQPTFPRQQERMMQPEPMQPPSYPPPQPSYGQQPYSKDLEIISAKLDSLRATLENINQRLATLERLAQGDSRQKYEW